MKRSGDSEREKRRKRRRLIQELGNQKIPFLGPSDKGFQTLWDSSYSGLVLKQACCLPGELHGRVQAALLTLQRKGCLLKDLVRIRDRDVLTSVSRALLGRPGHTYRYLDTRLFAIPWHGEDVAANDQSYCDPDLGAACRALWELNCFFCSDVPVRKGEGHVAWAAAPAPARDEDAESKHSHESKASEGGDSDSKQSPEADAESKHSEEWDSDSKHSSGGCSEPKPPADWDAGSRHSSDGSVGDRTHGEAADSKQRAGCSSEEGRAKPSGQDRPVTDPQPPLESEEELNQDSSQSCSQASPPPAACVGPTQFNVTLLNYMDPAAMSQLKEEPYYGMGKMAVGWHHDENLVSRSPVAVYSHSCHNDKGASGEGSSGESLAWRIGLKVAWDIHTPGLSVPLQSGDCYYMKDDLNRTHQHCVLAGDCARFSSTHRVAECSSGTLDYIQKRCREALSNLRTDPETGSHSLLSLLPSTLQHCEEIHNEVEFEWLRQYWFQGQRYARFCSWWSKPMEQLEDDWRLMEVMTKLFLAAVEEEEPAWEGRREMADILLNALTDRQQHRQTWRDRCHSSLAQSLAPAEAPVDRPFWGCDDASMPLPFDLADIINRVESLLWRM